MRVLRPVCVEYGVIMMRVSYDGMNASMEHWSYIWGMATKHAGGEPLYSMTVATLSSTMKV